MNRLKQNKIASTVIFYRSSYYKVCGEYAFGGDLLVTEDALYFLTKIDLLEEQLRKSEFRVLGSLGFGLYFHMWQLLSSLIKRLSKVQASEECHAILTTAEMKTHLAAPNILKTERFSKQEIEKLTIHHQRCLSFRACDDWQDFQIDADQSELLKNTLIENGFIVTIE